jgi:hypothetical protein
VNATSQAQQIETTWQAASVNTLLCRVAAADGTGQPTGVRGEGNWIKQADVSTLTYLVQDITDETAITTVVSSTSLTVSTVISDTPTTNTAKWTADGVGYNFAHSIPVASFPTRGNRYRVVYTLTLTSGNASQIVAQGEAL